MISDEHESDLRLEQRLHEEFRRQLDGQVGRAAVYFIESCAARESGRHSFRPPGRLLAGLAAVAAAACLAIVAWSKNGPPVRPEAPNESAVAAVEHDDRTSQHDENLGSSDIRSDPQPGTGAKGGIALSADAPSSEPLILASAISAHTVDDGVLLVGRTPLRKFRRQWLERVEWFDPQNGARVQKIVPHEQAWFVPLPIN